MPELLIPLAVFVSAVFMVGLLTQLFSNISLNRTLREALRSHPDSVPVLAQRLDARQRWADSLTGWTFIAFALGLVLMSLFESAEERRDILQASIVPLVIGLVVIFYVRRVEAQDRQDARSGMVAPAAPVPPPPPAPRAPRRRRSAGDLDR